MMQSVANFTFFHAARIVPLDLLEAKRTAMLFIKGDLQVRFAIKQSLSSGADRL
jgi:hypothetical protein